ncbi:glycoside hydrolase family 5 protein [Phenylobacterium sp.]|uniref:glycoside hydrolase family 5 protein n=1 Tax=Phenylobacterium sp. TaxID=1871053 RepID=UPI002811F6B2|nr:glycoside hydrolase family 5 protein [Phenylobacterium sp.]
MKRLLALALFVLLPGAALAETPVERHGQLRLEGTRLVDQHGEPVTLRGMSLFWSQWAPQYYNAAAVRWLKDDWSVTVVRAAIAVHHDGYLDHPEREMAKAEAVIDAAIAEGLYVIVDWHAHEPEPEAAAAFFTRIAEKYGDRPNLIYEPWNEPLNTHSWGEVVRPYHMAVIPRIRAHDPDNLIVAGTPSWSQDVDIAAADPLPFANVAYTLHFYAGTHRQELRDKAKKALELGAALFVTEWGTSEATGNGILDRDETALWWDFMEVNGLSSLNWSITDKDETSAALRPGAAGEGAWEDAMISPSGLFVRAWLRRMNPPAD